MAEPTQAELALRGGDTELALRRLQDEIRSRPGDARLRVFLFQLLCVMGRWERALSQLQVAGDLDASTLPMVQTYREAIQCERLREEVFAGRKVPLMFGQPQEWMALMVEALLREGRGGAADRADAAKLRADAFEQAPAVSGTIDGQAFEWIADADMRIGPVLEAVINGKYFWVPWVALQQVVLEAPADLRDRVWTPAQLMFANGGESVALIPTRYAGSDLADPLLALARRTDWAEPMPALYVGQGQRMLATDQGDHALMDVREIRLGEAADPAAA